jgi:fibronectin type 3 domain-containing protein
MKNYLVAASAIGIAASAFATVSSTLVADNYLVTGGGKTYSVLDIYVKGNNVGDLMGGSVLGAGTHGVVFATSQATGVTRDASGKVTAGAVTGDIFVQGDGSGWLPTNNSGSAWDSFIAVGNRGQGNAAKVTNRAGVLKDQGQAANMTAASGFSQMSVAGSSFIDSGTTSGWFSAFGGNGHSAGGASENPFARLDLYQNAAFTDLPKTGLTTSKGALQNGATTAGAAAIGSGAAGATLDFHWMLGRFAIDVTGKSPSEVVTMNVQFNMVGKNGTAPEAGTTFSGAITASYKVSQFFVFGGPVVGPPASPTGVTATDGTSTSGVSVSWTASAGATSYKVFRDGVGGATQIGTVTATSFTDTAAAPGVAYQYTVVASGAFGDSSASAADGGWRKLSPPQGVAATDGSFGNKVQVTWSAADGATSYKVLRALGAGAAVQIGTATSTAYGDLTTVSGVTYMYSVVSSCSLGDSDPSAADSGYRLNDCNNNGIDDGLDLDPPTTVTTGNMGTLVGATTRTSTKSVSALSTSTVTVSVNAIGDLDSTSEYLIVRLSNPPSNVSGIVRNLFLSDGLACPATPQRATFTLTKEEFNGLLGNAPGSLKIDVTPTAGVGGTDSTCQATSSVAVSIDYVSHNAAIDCNDNGVIDSCDIASGAATDCNSNGIPDSCDIASGLETDLNGNGKADRCEYLVGSPAWPTVAGAVSAAPAGSTVLVLPGTYDGPVDLGLKGLTLRSTGGKGNTTIRAVAGGTAIRVAGGGRVEGFFIQGGAGDTQTGTRRGGAMVITGGDVTVKDCDLRAGDTGSAGEGGLVFIRNAQPTFDTCRLEFGFAGSGGGVYAIASDAAQYAPVFTNCIVRSNNAGIGGGMLLRGSGMRPVLQGVLFELNQATGAGGALAMLDGARPTLNGCKACGNTAVVVSGAYDVAGALSYLTDDCNGDGACDADQIAAGQLTDLDADGIPDTCQDCDGDGYSDRYAIAQGMVPDCDGNLVPDACDLAAGAPDCNGNGVPDTCDARSTVLDCNRDGVVDSCQALADCNANGRPDVCEIAAGLLPDCNSNGVPDGCEVASGSAPDCNANGIPDACDISAGREEDQDGGGVPDACQYAVGDLDLDGATNTGDLAFILLLFDSPGPIGDMDGDGIVSTADVALVLLYFE